jgi:hypothetical protein
MFGCIYGTKLLMRLQCEPPDRQWPGNKCVNCQEKDLDCGPSTLPATLNANQDSNHLEQACG